MSKRANDMFVSSASTSYVEKMSSNDDASLCHARLGYLNVMVHQNLVKVYHFKMFRAGEVCEGCQYG